MARASTIIERPRKLPISTICPPGFTSEAQSHSLRAWPGVIQPSTSATAALAASNPGSGGAAGSGWLIGALFHL